MKLIIIEGPRLDEKLLVFRDKNRNREFKIRFNPTSSSRPKWNTYFDYKPLHKWTKAYVQELGWEDIKVFEREK